MSLPLDEVEREIARLWKEETAHSGAPRVELLTLVALVSDPSHFDRAQRVVARVAEAHPSRTVVASWKPGAPASITAEVSLHRAAPSGPARGDAIALEAVGEGHEWLPATVDRLALSDMPLYLWWVGDLPDHDDLFDRLVAAADLVVVDSGEMNLRDLEVLSQIVDRSRDRYAISDLSWMRLRSMRDLVARFFDDESARARLHDLERVRIDFAPAESDDVPSTPAALLLGWMATVLSLERDDPRWSRGEGWLEAALGRARARFEPRRRSGAAPGSIQRLAIECHSACFEIETQEDQQLLRWRRDIPGAPTPPEVVRLVAPEEATLLVHSLEHPQRDSMFEASLRSAAGIVRPIAPRLSFPQET